MAYIEPKINWTGGDIPTDQDFNRIEGNTVEIKNKLDNIESGETTFTGVKSFSDTIKVNYINDISGNGVVIENVTFKNGAVYGLVWGA